MKRLIRSGLRVSCLASVLTLCSTIDARASEITQLKPLYPNTALAVEGSARCIIVAPKTPAWIALANEVAKNIERIGGARPEVIADTTLVSPQWKIDFERTADHQLIALGNVNSNLLLSVLWGQGYTAEDDAFPGLGGYVIRTVHDPFARGLNVIVLAGSDPGAVKSAASTLLYEYSRRDGDAFTVPGPVLLVRRGAAPDKNRQDQLSDAVPTPEEFASSLDQRVLGQISHAQDEDEAKKPTLVNVTSVLAALAKAWFYTGDSNYLPLMKQLVDHHRKLLGTIPRRIEMEGGSAEDTIWWDVVEELPIWTDADRLDIVNAFRRDTLQGHEHTAAYNLVKEGYTQVLTENHGTASALHTFEAWRYFAKYYDLPEEAYWMSTIHAVFAGQLASHQILEDSSVYTPFTSEDTAEYATRSGDTHYYDLGIARTNMEFVMQCCYSNLGLSTGFGDAYRLSFPWGVNDIARIGWFYKDPTAAWFVRHYMPEVCGVESEANAIPVDLSIPMREPVEMTGMKIIPIYKQNLGYKKASQTLVTTPREPVGPEWFNKIVFRDRWSPDAQYLLLDGAGGSNEKDGDPPGPVGHSQDDINTINTFTDQGRMWLVDHTYSDRAIQAHNGLTITRDGELDYSRHLARLKNAVEGAGFAVSRSTYSEFSGATWERTIFWRRGEHFVVLDRAIAQKPGFYTMRCNFRTLGQPTLTDNQLRLTQDGRFFQIVTPGDLSIGVTILAPPDPSMWGKQYPHAAPLIHVLEEYRSARLAPGETLSFANLLKAAPSTTDLDTTSLSHAGTDSLLARTGKMVNCYGLAHLPGNLGEADAFAFNANSILLAGLRRLGPSGAALLTAEDPFDLWLSDDNKIHLRSSVATQLTIADKPVQLLAAGETVFDDADLVRSILALASQATTAAENAAATAVPTAAAGTDGESPRLASAVLDLNTNIRNLRVANLKGDGHPTWLATGNDGLTAFTSEGHQIWRFAPGKPCNALDVGDIDGDGVMEIIVGCDNEKIYLVDSNGRARWSYTMKKTDRSQPPVPDQVRIADLDADGMGEIIASGNWIHCLNGDGSLRWEDYWRYQRGRKVGDVQSFDISDINHDGKLEVICAIDLNYPVALGFNADGKRVYPLDPTGQPSHKPLRIHPPNATLLIDLFNDGGDEQIVVGATDELNLRWTGGERDTKTAGDHDGGRIAIAAIRPAGERPILVTATDMGALLAYRASGESADGLNIDLKRTWTQVIGDKITSLRSVVAGEHLLAAVGTRGGSFRVFDGLTGAPLGHLPATDGAVIQIAVSGDHLLVVHDSGRVNMINTLILH